MKSKFLVRSNKATRVQVRDSYSPILVKPKRSQITIFIILALVIIGGVIAYFLIRTPYVEEIPVDLKPAYDSYLLCIEQNAREGIALLGSQGGYIELPEFVPGSQYMPFSSQLNFYGQLIPYWMYVSGNNFLREQVPTKSGMEKELSKYINDRLIECDFSDFFRQGFDISVQPGEVSTAISPNSVDIKIKNIISISYNNKTAIVNDHSTSVNSKLGKFYDLALATYNHEKQDMFLENYAVDVLNLYAPVDGVELTCSPKIFNEADIRTDLTNALTENFAMIKLKGSYYQLNNEQNKYFVTNINKNVDESVNFIYSPSWPSKIEIYGDLINTPVGLQKGMGILGFCYVPYHLVYDLDFPVLIQFYDSSEIFQFPIGVVIDKNQARNALPGNAGEVSESTLCNYRNQKVQVYTYDSELNPINARIKFSCFTTECYIGESSSVGGESVLEGDFPQCVNGFILASAPGYADSKYQISTNEESVANIVMNKLYNVSLRINARGAEAEYAIVTFSSEEYTTTAVYPEMKNIQLPEGYYNVSVYIYRNSSIKIPASSERKCVMVPSSGIAGVFGFEKERCFDITIPEQQIDIAVIGGGMNEEYFTADMLARKEMKINANLFKTPSTIADINENFVMVENSNLEVQI